MSYKRGKADEMSQFESVGVSLYRIPPYYFLHVQDQNTNVTRLEIGPQTFIRHDYESVVLGPEAMVRVPPNHYCTVENPVTRSDEGAVVLDKSGQVKLHHADLEIRLEQDPFPLYPGEILKEAVTQLKIVKADEALRLRATLDFKDGDKALVAGDEWLFEGPGTYIPRKEVLVIEIIRATIIRPNQAIKLVARKECKDREGNIRVAGEEWLVKKTGAYLPGAYEDVVNIVDALVLTEKQALHMRCKRTFKDDFGVLRKSGEEWLIKMTDTETHISHVYEEVVGITRITTLTNRQYCVILDPVDEQGHTQLGEKKLVKGPKSFFLLPNERLEKGIQPVFVLGENEALILKANQEYMDENTKRMPGDRWMVRGPLEYIPAVEIEVETKQTAIPLDENEGIYVRNVKNGKVRAITGQTYMLHQDEQLWEKTLSPVIEAMLMAKMKDLDPVHDRAECERLSKPGASTGRDKTRVITFRVPHNAAVQIYDYKDKNARVVFGPEQVMLGPDEQFSMLSLSGDQPKRPNVLKSLVLQLGPHFCTDIIVVETADHARLSLQLSYNWHFHIKDKNDENEAAKLFSVPDFVGDACKAVASRVRGAVASIKFDDFHKNSAKIIRHAVFGYDESGHVREEFCFEKNSLVITGIDIQSVEPVDQHTRDSLQKSVQLAIEITTSSQEAAARHEAERLEQEAQGTLERQKISDEAEAERSRKELLELQAHSAAVESTGQAKAEAQSRAEASKIEGEAAVQKAKLKAEAMKIESEAELQRLTQAREQELKLEMERLTQTRNAELKYIREQNEIEINKKRELASIETDNFQQVVASIGAETIKNIAVSGPEMKVKLLQSLGLKSTLITDGSSPINLFSTAQGLIGGVTPMQTGSDYST